MYRSVRAPLALLSLLVLTPALPMGEACPRSCNCYQANEVHCTFRSLLIVPPGLPAHTRRINLGFNSISRIHNSSLAGLKKVELLMFHSNDIHHLQDGVFRDMKSLQILKLSYNKLREISSSLTFSGLTSLLRLYLDHNLLQHIHPRALLQLPSLRLLRLQGNRLHQLHPHALCTLSLLNTYYFSTLRHLDLSNNSLTTLSRETLATAPQLETLALQANPWSCDCRMNWFLGWSQAHPGLMKCLTGSQCPICGPSTSLHGQALLEQTDLSCTSPGISSEGRDPPLETEISEVQSSESFREPLGTAFLNLSDQQGNSVDLSCNITQSTEPQGITPPPDLSLSSSSPLPLALSLSLECPMERQSYEKLWRILAYYSETAVRLEREIMLSKAPTLAYRYKQAAETEGYYHTGVKASVKARPHWLLQPAISIQLNREQSNGHKVHLIYSSRVTAHPDPTVHSSASAPTFHPWVLISTNHTITALAAAAGSKVELPCPLLSSGNPQVQWILPDGSKHISNSHEGRLRASTSGLVLHKVQLTDAGIYYCLARAGTDVDVLPLRLAVEESSVPPSGEQVGPSVTSTVGEHVILSCKASGSPMPQMSWLLPDGNIVRQGVSVSGGLRLQPNGSLSLHKTSKRDTGFYRCIAVSQYGSDSMSMKLDLNSQHTPLLRTSFPRGPQSAAGRSTKIRAPLLHQIGEGSGDGAEEEESRTADGEKMQPRPLQPFPNRRFRPGQPRRRGPMRGPLRRVSPTDQRRNLFQNRHRVTPNKKRIDPQKWADILAKIRQKTATTNSSQPVIAAEPKGTDKTGDTEEQKGDHDKSEADGEGVDAETEGSSIDAPDLQEEGLQPINHVLTEMQINSMAKMDTEIDIKGGEVRSTENPTDITSNTRTNTQTEEEGPRAEVGANPERQNQPVTSEPVPNPGEGDKQGANPVPSRISPQRTRLGLSPNLAPNSRPQSPWNSRRRIGQRRRIINRPRVRPLTPTPTRPDPMSQKPQIETPETTTEQTDLLLPATTVSSPAVLLTQSDYVRSRVTVNSLSPSVFDTSKSTSTSVTSAPSFASPSPSHEDMITHPAHISGAADFTFSNTPAPTQSDTTIAATQISDPVARTHTPGIQLHAVTHTALSKHADRASSKHREEPERNLVGEPYVSHSSTSSASSTFSSAAPTDAATKKMTTAPTDPPQTTTESTSVTTSEETFGETTTFNSLSTAPITTAAEIIPTSTTTTSTATSFTTTTTTTSVPTPTPSLLSHTTAPYSTTTTTNSPEKTTASRATTIITVSAQTSSTTTVAPTSSAPSTTTTTVTASTASPREKLNVDHRGRPSSGDPDTSRLTTDWKNPGANSIPDSHGSRPRWPPTPLLPPVPAAPLVRSRPRIADPHIRTMSVPAESTARLDCEAQGEPKPSITWTKVATGAVMSIHSRAQRFEVSPNGTLIIQNVQLQDRGTYICSAHSFLGRDRLLTTLEVWTRPPRMLQASYRETTTHQGGDVHLNCQADGVPTPLLSWVLPDRTVLTSTDSSAGRLTMDSNGTLHISVTLPSDRGMYRCVASNSAGAASASVRVHVSSLPPVMQLPREEHLLLSPGRPVYAHCAARGAPPPTLRWRIPDGTLVRPSQFLHDNLFVLPNGTLHIRKLGPKDSGNYVCSASNAVGADKRTVRVEIVGMAEGERRLGEGRNDGAKALVTEKTSSSSLPYKNRNLSTPSQSSNSISSPISSPSSDPYQHNSTHSPVKINKTVMPTPTQLASISKEKPSSHSPHSAGPKNNTKVPSISTNHTRANSSLPSGKGRASAALHPLPISPFSKAHIVSTSPAVSTIQHGSDLQLHCSVTGNPSPIIIWRTPSKKLVDMHFSFDRRLKVHPNGTLSIQAVTDKEAGDYLCIARNKVADDYRLLRVSVATKSAKIEPKQPLNQMVLLGKPLKVDCQATGLPDPAVHWRLPDGTMVNSVLQGEERGGRARRLTVFENGTLLVPAVGMGEEGEYTCYAENQGGRDTMKVKVKVMMTSPPTFTNDRGYYVVKVRQGENARIPCQAKGDPVPTITWFSPSQRLIPQNLGSRIYFDRVAVVSDGTLQVRMAQKFDAGNYTCRASNSAGGRSMLVGLEVEAPNPGPSHPEEGRGWSPNIGAGFAHSSRSGHSTNDAGTTRYGFTHVVRSKLANSNSSHNDYSLNNGGTGNTIPNSRINAATSGFHPALRSDGHNGFNRPVTRITTQLGSTENEGGLVGNTDSKPNTTGIKINEPGIVSGRNSMGNHHSIVRGVNVERNSVTNNHEVSAKNFISEANTSRDRVLSSSVSNSGAAAAGKLGGSGHSRSSEIGATGDNSRKFGASGSSGPVVHNTHAKTAVQVKTVKQKAVRDQTVLLPCPSQGSPPPRLTWLLPGNGVLPAPYYGSRLTVHRNGSLELRGVRVSDSGTLVCVVKGERNETRIQVELEVSDAQGEASVFHRGLSGERAAQESAGLSAASARSGTPLESAQSVSSKSALPGTLPALVTQRPLSRGWSSPAEPRPFAPPSRAARPHLEPAVRAITAPLVTISNGETLRLPCPASQTHGHSQGSLSWTTPSGKVLSQGESADSGRLIVQEDGTLTVLHTTVFDRGTYTCKSASYDSSLVSSVTVPVIIIAYPPRITKGPSPVTYTRPGVAVELPCLTIATPRATVTWETPDLTRLRVMGQARIYGNRYLSPQGSLVIQNPTSRDTGFYRCTANNVIGVDTKATYLHVI